MAPTQSRMPILPNGYGHAAYTFALGYALPHRGSRMECFVDYFDTLGRCVA